MDTRTLLRIAGLLAVALVCAPGDRGAIARQGFRAVTQLIRIAAPTPPPVVSVTSGVRG